jgi:hypothetical protein
MSATDLFDAQPPSADRRLGYLDQQADRYKQRTPPWWYGSTPSEDVAAERRARERQPQRPGQAPQRQPTREEQLRQERQRQPIRRRAGEGLTPVRTGQQEQAVPAAPVVAQMTAEATQFFGTQEGRQMGDRLDAILGEMYADRRGRGATQDRDGDILTRIFGAATEDADHNMVPPQQSRDALRAELYRLFTSTAGPDEAERRNLGITVSGTAPNITVTADWSSPQVRGALKTWIRRRSLSREQATRTQ